MSGGLKSRRCLKTTPLLLAQSFIQPALIICFTTRGQAAELWQITSYTTPNQVSSFPNLVYKLPERDAGGGITFIKARSSNHARKLVEEAMMKKRQEKFLGSLYAMFEDQKGIFQSYIHSPMLSGRKLYKIRAHLLITPAGLQFLEAHRVISKFSVPDTLPFGIVQNPQPFLVNLSSSKNYEIIPSEEEQALKEAALAIGKGLSWAVKYGFQTGS